MAKKSCVLIIILIMIISLVIIIIPPSVIYWPFSEPSIIMSFYYLELATIVVGIFHLANILKENKKMMILSFIVGVLTWSLALHFNFYYIKQFELLLKDQKWIFSTIYIWETTPKSSSLSLIEILTYVAPIIYYYPLEVCISNARIHFTLFFISFLLGLLNFLLQLRKPRDLDEY
ncbi:MAG: hypothetical protein ACFFDN_08815 [Candidatus Hodarchaeota archaeon]